MYSLTNPELWRCPERTQFYRTISSDASYNPDEPFESTEGRFSNGIRATLYLSETPEGAIAEWLRRHPEFISMQHSLRVSLNMVEIVFSSTALDIRTSEQAKMAAFPFDRLRSSESDPKIRYKECRVLATDVENVNGSIGILYPSAALKNSNTWNIVLFGKVSDNWHPKGFLKIDRPVVDEEKIQLIDRDSS